MIGLGVASFSHIGGTHFQNEHDWDPYIAKVGEGTLPIYRALTPTPEESMIRELILQMKLGHVQRAYFQGKFGVDIRQRFAGPFSDLRDQGFLKFEGDDLRLNRDGLLQVDRLLHQFFLPEHRNARYA
jgi:oxygen-independent coproporphyrinogen-3 oxidase